jgi:hypothetical protein
MIALILFLAIACGIARALYLIGIIWEESERE